MDFLISFFVPFFSWKVACYRSNKICVKSAQKVNTRKIKIIEIIPEKFLSSLTLIICLDLVKIVAIHSESVKTIMLYSIRTVTVSAFRIFSALKPNPWLLTSSLNSCFKIHTAQLHKSSPSGGFATRFRNHRRANGSQQRTTGKALLDKFVKHLSLDGGNLVTKYCKLWVASAVKFWQIRTRAMCVRPKNEVCGCACVRHENPSQLSVNRKIAEKDMNYENILSLCSE